MRMKTIFIILILLTLIPLVNAESSYTFKQGETIDLKISCFNNDYSSCDSSTDCNITIYYPNSSALVSGGELTYGANYYNYTIDDDNTGIS